MAEGVRTDATMRFGSQDAGSKIRMLAPNKSL
jgi:hypothetical protein